MFNLHDTAEGIDVGMNEFEGEVCVNDRDSDVGGMLSSMNGNGGGRNVGNEKSGAEMEVWDPVTIHALLEVLEPVSPDEAGENFGRR